jgi:hypothetical protein
VSLSPEFRQRIYEEERIRLEAQARFQEEMRLRKQNTTLALRLFLMVVFFAVGFVVSEYYLKQSQAIPESETARPAGMVISQLVLDEIARVLRAQPEEAAVCVRAVSGSRSQIRATVELARDVSRDSARRLGTAHARLVADTLKRYGLPVPAYVEVFSPKRWHGIALVEEADASKITWDACPGRCEEEGTLHVRRCTQ